MLNIFKLLIKLGDLAAVELKFSFPYAIHFTCYSKTLHLLLYVTTFLEFGIFFQLFVTELKEELLLLKNISECDYLKIIGIKNICIYF